MSFTLEEITIDGQIYRRQAAPSPIRIIVAQRGWVFIGRIVNVTDDEITLEDAANFGSWGTSGGLGQLAKSGPTDSTKIFPAGTVRIHPLAVVASIDCDESVWADRL